jgi:hypothetical protein
MASMANDKPRFDLATLLQAFHKLRYWSPVAMLTVAIVVVVFVFSVIGLRTANPTVQITIIISAAVVGLGFFAAVVLTIKSLGPYALLSGTQVMSYRRMELAAKDLPEIPLDSPAISDPANPMQGIEGNPDEKEGG